MNNDLKKLYRAATVCKLKNIHIYRLSSHIAGKDFYHISLPHYQKLSVDEYEILLFEI